MPCRFQHASLVCKRFNALCLAPQLLRTVDVSPAQAAAVLPRLRALAAFLAAHGQHIQRLSVDVSMASLIQRGEALAFLGAGLEACGGAGSSLRQLDVACWGSLPTSDWLPGLTALRHLELNAERDGLFLPASIDRLSLLEEACLEGRPLKWGAVQRLPPSLTSLALMDMHSTELPTQASPCQPTCPPA